MRKLILASSSPYRRAILDKIHLSYHSISPQIDESPITGENVSNLVQRLALKKAQKVAQSEPDSLIIGSDQAAFLNGEVLSKPGSIANAQLQLAKCSNNTVTFHTGLCLLDSRDNSYQCEDITFKVHFRSLSKQEIEHYIAIESPLDCAGSFKVEALGISLFERLEGEDFNSLIGLPLIALLKMLRNKGVNPLNPLAPSN